jgi:hypothetical protein
MIGLNPTLNQSLTKSMLMIVPFVFGLALQELGQESGHAEPPRLLYIFRQFWKPGHQAALDRIEAEAARTCIGLGIQHPYLGIESLSGSKEVWYLNAFSSTEELAQITKAYSDNPKLTAEMGRFAEQRKEFESRSSLEGLTTYRPELSRGVQWEIGRGQFLVVQMTKGDPTSEGSVFESQDGERFVITPAKTLAEAKRKLAAAGPNAKIFAVRPEFSMAAEEWVAHDPSLWQSSQRKR